MKIKKVTINGFRCLMDFEVSFEDDLTVIVGENDSGKSSLLDCMKVITQNKAIEIDDFNDECNKINLSIEVDDFIFDKEYTKDNEQISEQPLIAKPTNEYLERIIQTFTAEGFNIEENDALIRETAKLFGLVVRSNSNMQTLLANIISSVEENIGNPEFTIQNIQFPKFNNIQLDGKQFENVSSFFKEVFLKEKQSSIWNEKINEETTIEDFIKDKISNYSEEISGKINERGIKDKIKLFLKDLTDIKVEPVYNTREVNIDAKVKFLEHGREINIQKKGDGTKRRITMALLEFKKEEALLSNDNSTIYLLDEPDTHLHVKAQLELLETLRTFTQNGNQVILTTHSPFIINALDPKQIRLIHHYNNKSKLKYLKDNSEMTSRILQSIGVENSYLFFARTLIIVEGETEENFIPNFYLRYKKKTLSSDLIKIINAQGINNIYGFCKGILELHNPERIFILFDNDASQEILELITELNISEERRFIIGRKEFEDAFSDVVLHRCWCNFHSDSGRDIPVTWTVENISCLREKCENNPTEKFSTRLRALNSGGKKMTKPIFGTVLAQYIHENEMPDRLMEVFNIE